eukprot:scaffold3164_cov237-Pinguiococcus_pyrenoidosus.AAC.4
MDNCSSGSTTPKGEEWAIMGCRGIDSSRAPCCNGNDVTDPGLQETKFVAKFKTRPPRQMFSFVASDPIGAPTLWSVPVHATRAPAGLFLGPQKPEE